MIYDGVKLNCLQIDEVILDFFYECFNGQEPNALENYIAKRMEDTENEFLMYTDLQLKEYKKILQRKIKEVNMLLNRDFHTEKFKDTFYYEG